jgi:phosphatidate cytidylyltransferase
MTIPVSPKDALLVYPAILIGLLVVATIAGQTLARFVSREKAQSTLKNINARVISWWVMLFIFGLAVLTGGKASVILFGIISFLALREFITLTPTRRSDHRSLFWLFFIIIPINYALLYFQRYGTYSIFIPVYAFLLIPIRSLLQDDPEDFVQRMGTIHWGLMVCVYCLSYAPALLILSVPGWGGDGRHLLFFLVMVTQLNDVSQYLWGKTLGRRHIAPTVSPNKTLAGLIGGVLTSGVVAAACSPLTPFPLWEAACVGMGIALLGFFGDLTMSAVKRDRGVKDFGQMIHGHGGIMDRMDSLCFAAPIFFHYTRFFHVFGGQ